MASAFHDPSGEWPERRRAWRLACAVVLLVWTTNFTMMSLLLLARNPARAIGNLDVRGAITLVGLLISLAIVWVHARTATRSLPERIAIAIAAAVAAAAVHAVAGTQIFDLMRPGDPSDLRDLVLALLDRFWLYLSISGAILVLSYALMLGEGERQLRALEARVHAAQVRTLRYQINPHFLFNTLNAIAALVRRRNHPGAEAMIENLSDFLRTGLSLDPHDDVTLAREIGLERLYLAIERQRFPERLQVEVTVPEELGTALLPSLITQPAIEAAIRHAVAPSTSAVRLSLSAERGDGMLLIGVAAEGGDAPARIGPQVEGMLDVLGQRLRARFAEQFRFETDAREGAMRIDMAIPLRFAA